MDYGKIREVNVSVHCEYSSSDRKIKDRVFPMQIDAGDNVHSSWICWKKHKRVVYQENWESRREDNIHDINRRDRRGVLHSWHQYGGTGRYYNSEDDCKWLEDWVECRFQLDSHRDDEQEQSAVFEGRPSSGGEIGSYWGQVIQVHQQWWVSEGDSDPFEWGGRCNQGKRYHKRCE